MMRSAGNGKIIIVGGGPGGLTLARLLQRQGAEVAVYERDFDRYARVQGSALDLHTESGLAALEEAGLMAEFRAQVRHDLDRLRLTDTRGDVLYDHVRGVGSGIERPEIERTPLRQLLLDSLEPGTVHWNKKLVSATAGDGEVQLHFADGETATASLALGADGANSRLRALVTPIRPQYAGVTLVEGYVSAGAEAVPELWTSLQGAALLAMGEEQTPAMATKSDGGLLFYAGLKTPADAVKEELDGAQTPEQRVAWFRTWFPAWDARWVPLFSKSQYLTWRPQMVCPADQHWEARAEVTLLGDAAHVMPPYAGEGVNMAMLDALVLSRELAGHDDRREAIQAYQEEMFARMAEYSGETMANTERFYAPDASAQVVGMFQGFARQAEAAVSTVAGGTH